MCIPLLDASYFFAPQALTQEEVCDLCVGYWLFDWQSIFLCGEGVALKIEITFDKHSSSILIVLDVMEVFDMVQRLSAEVSIAVRP